jgi:hypothetical protein
MSFSFMKTSRSFGAQAKAIECKRDLLSYLRSGPQQLTIESYLCLSRILTQAGWRHEGERWRKGGKSLATVEAAIVELQEQVTAERDRLLQQTVKSYGA